jgi:tryptophan-rich sensory protein
MSAMSILAGALTTSSAFTIGVPSAFAVAIASNAFLGRRIGDLSDRYRTAITPAGYAFSIWGAIYTGGLAFSVYCAVSPGFAARVGPMATANMLLNAAWVPLWCNEHRLPAQIVLCGVLATCTSMWHQAGSPSGPAASLTEWLCVRPFLSLYQGWLLVACTVGTAATLMNPDDPKAAFLGWSPSSWAKGVLPVATGLSLWLGYSATDPTIPAVGAWALLAIAQKQRSDPRYPGDASVVQVSEFLGYGLCAAAVHILVLAATGGPWWLS